MSEFLQYLNELEEKTKQTRDSVGQLGSTIDAIGKESGNIDKLTQSFDSLIRSIQKIGRTKVNINISNLSESALKAKNDIDDLTASFDRLQARINEVSAKSIEIKVSATKLNELEETLRNIHNLSDVDFTNIGRLVKQLRSLSRVNIQFDSLVQLKDIIDRISSSPITVRVENSQEFTTAVQQAQRLHLLLQEISTNSAKPKIDFSFLVEGIRHTEQLLSNIRNIENSFAALQTGGRGKRTAKAIKIDVDIKNLQELEKLSKQAIVIPVILDIQNKSEIESLVSRGRISQAEKTLIEPYSDAVSFLQIGGSYSNIARGLVDRRQSVGTARSEVVGRESTQDISELFKDSSSIYKKIRNFYNTSIFVLSTFGEIFNAYDRFNQSFQNYGQYHPATIILGIGGMAKALTAFTKLTVFTFPKLRSNKFLSGFTEDTAKTFAQLVEGFVAGFSGVNLNEIRAKMRKAAVEAKLKYGIGKQSKVDLDTISEQVKKTLGGKPRTPIDRLVVDRFTGSAQFLTSDEIEEHVIRAYGRQNNPEIKEYIRVLQEQAESAPNLTEGALRIAGFLGRFTTASGEKILPYIGAKPIEIEERSSRIGEALGYRKSVESISYAGRTFDYPPHKTKLREYEPASVIGVVAKQTADETVIHELGHAFDFITRRVKNLKEEVETTKQVIKRSLPDFKRLEAGHANKEEKQEFLDLLRAVQEQSKAFFSNITGRKPIHPGADWRLMNADVIAKALEIRKSEKQTEENKLLISARNKIISYLDYIFDFNEAVANIFTARTTENVGFEQYLKNIYSLVKIGRDEETGEEITLYDKVDRYIKKYLNTYVDEMRQHLDDVQEAVKIATTPITETRALIAREEQVQTSGAQLLVQGQARRQEETAAPNFMLGAIMDKLPFTQVLGFIVRIQEFFNAVVNAIRSFILSAQDVFKEVISIFKTFDREKVFGEIQKRIKDTYSGFDIEDQVVQIYASELTRTAKVFPNIAEGSLQINQIVNNILSERGVTSRPIIFSLFRDEKELINFSDEIAKMYGMTPLKEIYGNITGVKGLHREYPFYEFGKSGEPSEQMKPAHFVGAVLDRRKNALEPNMFAATHELGHAFDIITRRTTETGERWYNLIFESVNKSTSDLANALRGQLQDEERLNKTLLKIFDMAMVQTGAYAGGVFERSPHHTKGWINRNWEETYNVIEKANKAPLYTLSQKERDILKRTESDFVYLFTPGEIIANIFSAKARQDTEFEDYLKEIYSQFTVRLEDKDFSIYDLVNLYVETEMKYYLDAVRENIVGIEDALKLAMSEAPKQGTQEEVDTRVIEDAIASGVESTAQFLRETTREQLEQIAQEINSQDIRTFQSRLSRLIKSASESYYKYLIKEWYGSAESVIDVLKIYAISGVTKNIVAPRLGKFLFAQQYQGPQPTQKPVQSARFNIQDVLSSPTTWNILTSQYLEATRPRTISAVKESEIRKEFITRTGLAVSDLQVNKLRDLGSGLMELEASATLADGSVASLNYTIDQWGRVTLKKAASAFDEFTQRISFRVIGELLEEGIEEIIFYLRNAFASILKTQSSFQEVGAFLGLDAKTFQVDFAKNLASIAFETGQGYTRSVEAALKNVELFNKLAPTTGAGGVLNQAKQFTRLQLAATTVFELSDEGMVADVPSIYRQLESKLSSDIPIEQRSQKAMAQMEQMMDYMVVAQRKTGADPRNLINTFAGLASSIGKLNITQKELITIAAASDVSLAESQEEKYNTLKLLLERIVLSENRKKLREYGLDPDKNLYQLILDIYRLSQTPETMGQYQRAVSEIGGAARANQVAQIIQAVGKDFELGSNSVLASLEQISGSEFENALERNVNTLQNTINKIDAAFMSFLNTILFGSGVADAFVHAIEKVPRVLNALEFAIQSVVNAAQTAIDAVTNILGITTEDGKEKFTNSILGNAAMFLATRTLFHQDSGRAKFNMFSWVPESVKGIENRFRALMLEGPKSFVNSLLFGEYATKGTIDIAKKVALFFIDEIENKEKQGIRGKQAVDSALRETAGTVQRLVSEQPQLLRDLSEEQRALLKKSPVQFIEQSVLSALGAEDTAEQVRQLEESTIKTQIVHQQIVHNAEHKTGVKSKEPIERKLRESKLRPVDKENLNATRKFVEELKREKAGLAQLSIIPAAQERRTSNIERVLAQYADEVSLAGKKYDIMRGAVKGIAEGAEERSGAFSAREKMWQRLGAATDILSVAVQEGLFYGAISDKEDAVVNGVIAGLGAAIGGAIFGPVGLMFGAELASVLSNVLNVSGRIGLSSEEARSISTALEKSILGKDVKEEEQEKMVKEEISVIRKELMVEELKSYQEGLLQKQQEEYLKTVRYYNQVSAGLGTFTAAAFHPKTQGFIASIARDWFGVGKKTVDEQLAENQDFIKIIESNEKLKAVFDTYIESVRKGEIQVTDVIGDFTTYLAQLKDADLEVLIQKKQQIEEEQRYKQALKDAVEALEQASEGLKHFKDMLDIAYQQKPFGGLTYGYGGTAMLALQEEYLKRLSSGQDKERVEQWFQQNQKKIAGFEEFANVLFTAGMVGGTPPDILQMQQYMESYMRLDDFGEQYVTSRLKTYTELMAFVNEYEQKQAELNYLQSQNYDVSKEEYKQVKERIEALQKELELHKLRYDMSVKALGAARSEKDLITKTIADVEKLQKARKPKLIREGTPAQFVAPSIMNIEEMGTKGFLEAIQYAREKQAKLIALNPEYRKKFAEEQFLVETPYGFRKVAGIDQSFVNEYITKTRAQMPEMVDLRQYSREQVSRAVEKAKELQLKVVEMAPEMAKTFEGKRLLLMAKNNDLLMETNLSQEYLRMALEENTKSNELRGHYNLPAGYMPPTIWDYYNTGGKTTGEVNYPSSKDGMVPLEFAQKLAQELARTKAQGGTSEDIGDIIEPGAAPFFYPKPGTPPVFEKIETDESVIDVATAIFPNVGFLEELFDELKTIKGDKIQDGWERSWWVNGNRNSKEPRPVKDFIPDVFKFFDVPLQPIPPQPAPPPKTRNEPINVNIDMRFTGTNVKLSQKPDVKGPRGRSTVVTLTANSEDGM